MRDAPKKIAPATGADEGYGAAELQRFDMLRADPVMSELQSQVTQTCEDLGFERFVAWVLWPAKGVRRSTFVTNYSPDWMRRRLRNNYQSHDLVAARAAQTGRPFFWAEMERRHLTEPQARVMEEARTFGLRTGAALSRADDISGRLCLCVSTITDQKDFAKLFAARRPQLDTLMKKISTQFRVFQDVEATRAAATVLTPHECEVLMYAGRGLTTQRTAQKMGVSDYTVKDHIKAAVAKLDAKNKTEAVVKALVAGYILP
jgi:DNA-binding CsgD family transcriptional regulator